MRTRHRRRGAAVLVACSALVLGACGGGGSDGEPDSAEELLEDLQDGDSSALDDLDSGDFGELLDELTDGQLGEDGSLGDGSGLEDLFGEDGLGGLEDLFGEDGSLGELEDLFAEGGALGALEEMIAEGGALGALEEMIEEQSGGAVDLDVGEDGMSVETEDGNVSVQTTDELPEDWPAEVPTPDDLAIETVAVADSSSMLNLTVSGSVDGDSAEWIEQYGAQLESAGFTRRTSNQTGEDVSGFYQSDDYDVFVLSNSFGDSTTVTVSLSAR